MQTAAKVRCPSGVEEHRSITQTVLPAKIIAEMMCCMPTQSTLTNTHDLLQAERVAPPFCRDCGLGADTLCAIATSATPPLAYVAAPQAAAIATSATTSLRPQAASFLSSFHSVLKLPLSNLNQICRFMCRDCGLGAAVAFHPKCDADLCLDLSTPGGEFLSGEWIGRPTEVFEWAPTRRRRWRLHTKRGR